MAEGHGFEGIEPFLDLRFVGFLSKAFFPQKGEGEDPEKQMVVGVEFRPADRSEPLGDLLLFFFGEWIPQELAAYFESQHQGGHFDSVLVVILSGAPIFR